MSKTLEGIKVEILHGVITAVNYSLHIDKIGFTPGKLVAVTTNMANQNWVFSELCSTSFARPKYNYDLGISTTFYLHNKQFLILNSYIRNIGNLWIFAK